MASRSGTHPAAEAQEALSVLLPETDNQARQQKSPEGKTLLGHFEQRSQFVPREHARGKMKEKK